ncbi:MAG: zinc dependent phospholipase C family protein [Clostridia bacterium]|nr:zinc dependent phospholipase C family protein [Clostridia bacterium]
MPDYFSHGVCAEIIYEKLESKYKNKIKNKTLYMLGAQGGDVFFAYNIKPTKSNLGRSMHRMDVPDLFEKLIEGNPSYAAGFATHYALDSTLHPKIYAYERTKRSPLTHVKFENDLGLYISRKFHTRRTIIPREKLLACTSPVYDSVKKVEPLVTITGVERCLKRHFAYSKFLYRFKRQNYKCRYDFSALSDDIDKSIKTGVAAVKSVLDGNPDPEIFNKKFLQS